jgi:serine/threonine protein kinase
MKPLGNIIQITDEPKKKIIFKVLLGQKRNLDYNPKDYYQSQKKNKKLFILEKPQNYINIKETKISNENNININVNIQNTKNTKNLVNIRIETTPVTAETNNNQKLNEIKNTEVNKIKNINNNKNNNLNNETNNNNKQQNNSKKQFGDYLCLSEDKIGSGSFGEVLYGINKRTHREVAVKVLNPDTSQENIKREINYTKQLQGAQGFPSLYYYGNYEKKHIIVESLLGPSLDKLFKFCGRMFPLKTVCLIGIEMVKRLETMHQKGILHRDLKPNNLTWGNFNNSYNNIPINNNNNININQYEKLDINTIYLIDFGLSCSYWENNSKKHYKAGQGLNFIGTLRYASLNSHKGIRQSRRDDLESMIYILIYFLKGNLAWQDVKAKNKEERYKLIQHIKTNVTIENLCKDIPPEFAHLLQYVKELPFDVKPDYYKFYNCFQNLINKINYEKTEEKNFNYIWEKKLVDYINDNNNNRLLEEIKNLIFKGYPINLKNFANYIIYNNKILNENIRKKENIYMGDSTESMESNTILK